MAKGKKTSLVVRALALLFALALVALAARLWLGSAHHADATGESVAAPPPHGEIGADDREALRDILRDSQTEPE